MKQTDNKRFWLFIQNSPDPQFFNTVEEANREAVKTSKGSTILERLESGKFITTSALISNTPKTLKEHGIDADNYAPFTEQNHWPPVGVEVEN